MRDYILLLAIFLVFIACDPCEECGDPLISEPTVRMVFINTDSIASIDGQLEVISFNDSAFNANATDLDSLRTRLTAIETGLDTAENAELEEEKSAVLALIALRETDSIFYDALQVSDDSISDLNAIKSSINSGLMLLGELSIPEVSESITFTDSATSWSIPLSFEGEFSLYELTIEGQVYSVTLDYETFTELDEERNITVRAQNIEVLSHTFKDLDPCLENCTDGNTTFTFDF